jgi:beta-glucanase (GH16 family)
VRYGTVAARIRMTGARGAWPAFWTLGSTYPQVGWPACGELDVMESYNDMSRLYGTVHGPTAHARGSWASARVISPAGGLTGWHVYAATWTRDALSFQLDGRTYFTVRRSSLAANQRWAMDAPQNLILNIAVGDAAGPPRPAATFRSTMEVDWVRVTSG